MFISTRIRLSDKSIWNKYGKKIKAYIPQMQTKWKENFSKSKEKLRKNAEPRKPFMRWEWELWHGPDAEEGTKPRHEWAESKMHVSEAHPCNPSLTQVAMQEDCSGLKAQLSHIVKTLSQEIKQKKDWLYGKDPRQKNQTILGGTMRTTSVANEPQIKGENKHSRSSWGWRWVGWGWGAECLQRCQKEPCQVSAEWCQVTKHLQANCADHIKPCR